MVLHELAHGYHQRFLGHDHEGIRRCYEQATAGKTYESTTPDIEVLENDRFSPQFGSRVL
jgi:hypothetical protein